MFHVKHENFMHKPICYYAIFGIVVMELNVVYLNNSVPICIVVPAGLILHSSNVKILKCSYNSVLRRLLYIRMPYSASAMFVTHCIPSFCELLRTCIYSFSERISSSRNSIIKACLSPIKIFSHP